MYDEGVDDTKKKQSAAYKYCSRIMGKNHVYLLMSKSASLPEQVNGFASRGVIRAGLLRNPECIYIFKAKPK